MPALAAFSSDDQRDDLLRGRDLRDHRLEARIEQRADVEFAGIEARQHLFGDVLGIDEAELTYRAQIDVLDDLLVEGAAELLVALAADAEEFHFLALRDQRLRMFARKTHDRRIERAAQAAFAGADQKQMDLILAGAGKQCRRAGRACRGGGDVGDHRIHLFGIGPRRLGRGLGTAQSGGRDHLHGLGDLLRRLGRGDADPHVFQ